MNSEQIVAVLLREVWWHYDHGGHSGRSWRAQLLETTTRYRSGFLDGVPSDLRIPPFFEQDGFGEEPTEQLRLFLGARYANDEEALKIVLWGLLSFYEEEPEYASFEADLVRTAATHIGLPEDGGSYRTSYEQHDRWELISELRARIPISFGF